MLCILLSIRISHTHVSSDQFTLHYLRWRGWNSTQLYSRLFFKYKAPWNIWIPNPEAIRIEFFNQEYELLVFVLLPLLSCKPICPPLKLNIDTKNGHVWESIHFPTYHFGALQPLVFDCCRYTYIQSTNFDLVLSTGHLWSEVSTSTKIAWLFSGGLEVRRWNHLGDSNGESSPVITGAFW